MSSAERRRRNVALDEANAEYTDEQRRQAWAEERSRGASSDVPESELHALRRRRPRRRRARVRHCVLRRWLAARRACRSASIRRRRSSRPPAAAREVGIEFALVGPRRGRSRCPTRRSTSPSPSTARRSGPTVQVDSRGGAAPAPRRRACLPATRRSAPLHARRGRGCRSRRSCVRCSGMHGRVAGRRGHRVSPRARRLDSPAAENGFELDALHEIQAPADAKTHEYTTTSPRTGPGSGRARRSGRAQRLHRPARPSRRRRRGGARSSSSSGSRSTSSRPLRGGRSARGRPVRSTRVGKARSVLARRTGGRCSAVDTDGRLCGRVYGKPASAGEAEEMLEPLSGRTHEVVSGLSSEPTDVGWSCGACEPRSSRSVG